MANSKILSLATLAALQFTAVTSSSAGEPNVPPELNQPHTHIVELKQNATLRMGDTISLKETAFSAKLVGFREPLCPGPRASCAGQPPVPEFQITNGTTTCDPNPKSRACLRKLEYTVTADTVKDRTAVVVRIKNRRIKTAH